MRVSSNFRGEVGLKPGLPAWTPAKRRKRRAPERGLQPASTRSLEPLLAIIIDTLLRSKNRFRMKIRSACRPLDNLSTIACRFLAIFAVALAPVCLASGTDDNPYAKWPKGPPSDPGFFPLAVWLQAPSNAQRYREAGLNTYVALWKGPTEEQLATLKKAGMRVICHQNDFALRHLDDPAIVGWIRFALGYSSFGLAALSNRERTQMGANGGQWRS